MREQTPRVTDSQLLAIHAASGGDVYDADYDGGCWMYDGVSETTETMEQIVESSKGWAERSRAKQGVYAGFPFVSWAQAQVRKGQMREAISVVDFGAVRVVIRSCDLADY